MDYCDNKIVIGTGLCVCVCVCTFICTGSVVSRNPHVMSLYTYEVTDCTYVFSNYMLLFWFNRRRQGRCMGFVCRKTPLYCT